MPILNYTTKIDYHKSISEIQKTLAETGAVGITIEYNDDKIPVDILFMLKINDKYIQFRLPNNYLGIKRQLFANKRVPRNLKTEEQAIRVAWRIKKDWIEAQCAFIQSEQCEIPELFLAWAVKDNGDTLYNSLKGSNLKMLTGGNEN